MKWDAHSLQQPPCKKPSHYGRVKNQQNITIMKVDRHTTDRSKINKTTIMKVDRHTTDGSKINKT